MVRSTSAASHEVRRQLVEAGLVLVDEGKPVTLASAGSALHRSAQSLYHYVASQQELALLITHRINADLLKLITRAVNLYRPDQRSERSIAGLVVFRLWANSNPNRFQHAFIAYPGPEDQVESSSVAMLMNTFVTTIIASHEPGDIINVRRDPVPHPLRAALESSSDLDGSGLPPGVGYPEFYWQCLRLWLQLFGFITTESLHGSADPTDDTFAHLLASASVDLSGKANLEIIYQVLKTVAEYFATVPDGGAAAPVD